MSPKLEELRLDIRAVSPVIGVILMVAITVILASVLGTFVLGMGQSISHSSPKVSLSVDTDTNSNNITISHNGGDGIDSSRTRVIVETGDTEITWNEISQSVILSVGETARIDLDDSGGAGVDWDDDGSLEYTTQDEGSAKTDTIANGDKITVTLIDVESQRIFFEITVTV